MTFYIDIYSLKDYTGKVIAYEPQVSFSIDDTDTLDIETLKKLKDIIQREVTDGINCAHRIYIEKNQDTPLTGSLLKHTTQGDI